MQAIMEIIINQMIEKVLYSGSITMGGARFNYVLQFLESINSLNGQTLTGETEQLNDLILFEITIGEKPIELDKDEYVMFLRIIADATTDFHNRKQEIEKSGSEIMGLKRNNLCRLSEKVLKTLTQPKFGCVFPGSENN